MRPTRLERPIRLTAGRIPASPGEIPSLDGLRAVSITLVLCGHLALPASGGGLAAIGVAVFFFISGFLITRLLFLENSCAGRICLGCFYGRRFARLYPALVVYLAVVSFVQWQRTGTTSLLELAAAGAYFSNYLISWRSFSGAPFLLPIGGFWSLAIEEHFYILMPLAAILLRMRAKAVLYAAIGVCVACLLMRTAELLIWPQIVKALVIYRHSETRFDAIAAGVAMAALAELDGGRLYLRRLSTTGWFLAGSSLFCATYLIRNDVLRQILSYSLQQIALVPIFCCVLFGELASVQRVLNAHATRWLGRLSYSLYIWQGGVKFLAAGWGGVMPWLASPPALLAITIAAALASYHLVERPVLTLRNRLLTPPQPGPREGIRLKARPAAASAIERSPAQERSP